MNAAQHVQVELVERWRLHRVWLPHGPQRNCFQIELVNFTGLGEAAAIFVWAAVPQLQSDWSCETICCIETI